MKIRSLIPLAALLALSSCSLFQKGPGMSVVRFYNNSGHTVLVEDNELRPRREGTFQYPTDSGRALIVFWSGCVHTYIAPDRKPGDFRATDWMLRGAYRTQLESDGKLYLLPPDVDPPPTPPPCSSRPDSRCCRGKVPPACPDDRGRSAYPIRVTHQAIMPARRGGRLHGDVTDDPGRCARRC